MFNAIKTSTMMKVQTKRLPMVGLAAVGRLLLSATAIYGIVSLSSCKDNDYDLGDVDMTVGIVNGELNIPASSTTTIKLSEVLDLEENGDLKEDLDGTYRFYKVGDNVDPTEVCIEEVTVKKASTESHNFEFDLTPRLHSRVSATVDIAKEQFVGDFEYNSQMPQEVIDLTTAETDCDMVLGFSFDDNTRKLLSSIDELSLTLPSYMGYDVKTSTTTCRKEENKIVMNNISTAKPQEIVLAIRSLAFNKYSDELGSLKTTNGKVSMIGKVKMSLKINKDINISESMETAKCVIKNSISFIDNITLKNVTGRFNPTIKLDEIGKTTISGLPDFLKEDGVQIDIDNPQLLLTIKSNLSVPSLVKGKINYIRNGEKGQIDIPEDIIIKPATNGTTETRVCICRKNEGVEGFDQVIITENLKEIFYPTLASTVSFEADAKADDSKESSFELGKKYVIEPSYEVNAPLAFAEDAKIIYKEVLDGWNEDVKDFDLKEGGYVLFTANVENKVPVHLNVKAKAVDINGKEMGEDVKIEVTGEVAASKDGKTPESSAIQIKITPKQGALKKIDGLHLTISGSAKSENTGATVVGVPLNARNHSLIAKDIAIKVVGTVLADLN